MITPVTTGAVDPRRFSPSTTRNREPILDVLARVVMKDARVLEIASGGGEHAIFFASRLPVISWQTSDPDPEARESIVAWLAHPSTPPNSTSNSTPTRVLPPLDLDVCVTPWPKIEADVIVCINMIHISPWAATGALFDRAREVLSANGCVVTYGPYKRDGVHTAPSNDIFDRNLRARNAAWGVRDLVAVEDEAKERGFRIEEITQMPANNLAIVFRLT